MPIIIPPDAIMQHAFHRWQELRNMVTDRYLVAVYYVDGQHWMTFRHDAINVVDNWDGRDQVPPHLFRNPDTAFFVMDKIAAANIAGNLRRYNLRLHRTFLPEPIFDLPPDQLGPIVIVRY